MTVIHFAVAKYIADRRKMEPKNIGVIAWSDGLVCGRFAGELDGTVKPPKLIGKDARKTYMRVVESWRLQFDKESLPIGRGRDDVPRSSPDFLQALARYSQENFVIVDGGHISDDSTGRSLPNVVGTLFEEMVDDSDGREGHHKSALIQTCESLLSPLENNARFHRDMSVSCASIERDFPFMYGFGDAANPEILLQAVSLANDDQVDSAAMKFRCVVQDEKLIAKSRCGCFIAASQDTKKTRDRISYLNKFSEIISVSNMQAAVQKLRTMGLPMSS